MGKLRTARLLLPLFVVALLFGVWYLLNSRAEAPPQQERSIAAVTTEAQTPDIGTREGLELPGTEASWTAGTELPLYPAERPLVGLSIRVEDVNDTPQSGVEVSATSNTGTFPYGLRIADDRNVRRRGQTDFDGNLAFQGLPAGPYLLEATAEDGRRVSRQITAFAGRDDTIRLTIEPPSPRADFIVRVLDSGGRPVPHAEVWVVGGIMGVGIAGSDLPPLTGATGEDGVIRFRGRKMFGAVVRAATSDGRIGKAEVWRDDGVERVMASGGLVVTVAAPGALEGSILGVPAERLAGAVVRAHALNNQFPYYTTHGFSLESEVLDGRYRFPELPAGEYVLGLRDPGGARPVLEPLSWGRTLIKNSIKPLTAEVAAGQTAVVDLEVTIGGTLTGAVRRADGTPVEGARIFTTYTPLHPNVGDDYSLHGVNVWRLGSDPLIAQKHPETHPETRTDEQGAYRLTGLQPGQYRVEVFGQALGYDRRHEVEVADGETTELTHVLQVPGVIQGMDPQRRPHLGVTAVGEQSPFAIATPRRGQFMFPGLPPGRYELASFHSSPRQAKVPLTLVEVRAGRTTWVNLAGTGPIRIEGRVMDGLQPVAGALVTFSLGHRATDAQGRFGFALSYPRMGTYTDWGGGIVLRVSVDDVRSRFGFHGMTGGEALWSNDLTLGTHSLQVRSRTVSGSPGPARISLESTRLEDGVIKDVYCSAMDTGPDGRLLIRHLAAGEYRAVVRFDNGCELLQLVQIPRAEPLTFTAVPTGNLRVLVFDAEGHGASGCSVTAYSLVPGSTELAEEFPARYAETDERGSALLKGIRTGATRIEASRSGGWGTQRLDFDPELTTLTEGGEQTVVFRVRMP